MKEIKLKDWRKVTHLNFQEGIGLRYEWTNKKGTTKSRVIVTPKEIKEVMINCNGVYTYLGDGENVILNSKVSNITISY